MGRLESESGEWPASLSQAPGHLPLGFAQGRLWAICPVHSFEKLGNVAPFPGFP